MYRDVVADLMKTHIYQMQINTSKSLQMHMQISMKIEIKIFFYCACIYQLK